MHKQEETRKHIFAHPTDIKYYFNLELKERTNKTIKEEKTRIDNNLFYLLEIQVQRTLQ